MDEGQPQGQFNQQPTPSQTESTVRKKPMAAIVLGTFVIVLVVLVGLTYISLQSTKNKLKTSQAQLKTSQAQLAAANNRIKELSAQTISVHDAKRKADLAAFADTVRAYNAKNHGHLTTEGSMSYNIYKTQLSKSISNFTDPETGSTYDFVGVAKVQSPPPLKVGTIQYQWPGKCGARTLVDADDDSLSAVATLLEDGSMYCLQV